MKYSPIIFAKAFSDVLPKTPKDDQPALLKRFALVLEKYGVMKDAAKILQEIKKIIAKRDGVSLIKIETARSLDRELTHKIKFNFDKNSDFTMKINEDLIAGVKIIIDDELSIDNSLQRRLKCLK